MPDILEPRLSTNDICKITTWSRWTIKRKIADGSFPKPERIGTVRHDVWRQSVIEAWLEKNTYCPTVEANYGVERESL